MFDHIYTKKINAEHQKGIEVNISFGYKNTLLKHSN